MFAAGDGDRNGGVMLALMLTYLLHSALWSGAVGFLVRGVALSTAKEHAFWKAALLGPLLTTLLATSAAGGLERALPSSSPFRALFPSFTVAALPSTARDAGTRPAVAAPVPEIAKKAAPFVVFGGAGLGVVHFLGAALLLARRLRGRQRVADRRALGRLEKLRARTRVCKVVLTESPEVGSPLVIGRGEICVPSGLLGQLSTVEIDAVFAHELAHIERHDGLWFPLVGLVQSLLWFQPLNHWLAARVRQSAELSCDERAVELTHDALSLARALFQVASHSSSAQRLVATPAMASSNTALVLRVKRLTRGVPLVPLNTRRGQRVAVTALTVLCASISTVSLRLAEQPLATAHAATAASKPPGSAAAPPLPMRDERAHLEEMAELAKRERELALRLELAQSTADATRGGVAMSVQSLELSQALRHVRLEQAWREQRFIEQSSLVEP